MAILNINLANKYFSSTVFERFYWITQLCGVSMKFCTKYGDFMDPLFMIATIKINRLSIIDIGDNFFGY